MKRRIIVFGVGAIGSVLAAKFSKKYDVVAVGRKRIGLRITGLINQRLGLKVFTQIPKIDKDTIVVLTTKAQDSVEAAQHLKKQLTKNVVIVCVQNGLGSDEIVRKITACRTVRAVTYLSAEVVAPGVVKLVGEGATYFGKDDRDIAHIFRRAGIKVKVVDELSEQIWEKLVFNCVINGLGTILNVPNNQLANPILDTIKKALVIECLSVAIKEGVKLEINILDKINAFIKVSPNVNSTLQDIRKGKRSEINYLNGAIVRLGEKHGIPTPVNRTICKALSQLPGSHPLIF